MAKNVYTLDIESPCMDDLASKTMIITVVAPFYYQHFQNRLTYTLIDAGNILKSNFIISFSITCISDGYNC